MSLCCLKISNTREPPPSPHAQPDIIVTPVTRSCTSVSPRHRSSGTFSRSEPCHVPWRRCQLCHTHESLTGGMSCPAPPPYDFLFSSSSSSSFSVVVVAGVLGGGSRGAAKCTCLQATIHPSLVNSVHDPASSALHSPSRAL
ncbi:hypothetical protein E2C01_007562 [Portunus trituberculatus]|uniref:Uncharacterized protein n=1 Tax=Portunus trituberculatus TaxID=210409 RepID=A0A5B7CYF4_PORTR|nr:hypothetical protein [Portunus trituberculatus]